MTLHQILDGAEDLRSKLEVIQSELHTLDTPENKRLPGLKEAKIALDKAAAHVGLADLEVALAVLKLRNLKILQNIRSERPVVGRAFGSF